MPPQWNGPADFNSSDVEFEEENTNAQPRYGQASIEKLMATALVDRLSSKKSVRTLKFGYGAPGAVADQKRWIARLEAFRAGVLNQDIKTPFTGEDLIRFYDVIIGKLRPYQRDLPVPLVTTIKNSIPVLLNYGRFNWRKDQGFDINPTDVIRMKQWFDDAVKAGRLARGRALPRTWIGFQTVSRLIKAFVRHGHLHGTLNWDVHASQVLSVLLVASTAQRSGDIHLTNGYKEDTGYFVKWQDVDVKVDGEEPLLSNVKVVITLNHTKGNKGFQNQSIYRVLTPLDDPALFHVDPCLWLMIVAMRTGQTKASIGEVLDNALKRPDRRVVWNNPTLPLVPMRSKTNTHLLLDRPTPTTQVLKTVKIMGLLAGMLGRAYTHALRLGATRDINFVPTSALDEAGFTSDRTRQVIGHSHKAELAGCTEAYAGGYAAATWSVRSKHAGYIDWRRPQFDAENQPDDHSEAIGKIPKVLAPRSTAQTNVDTARLHKQLISRSVKWKEAFDQPNDLELAQDTLPSEGNLIFSSSDHAAAGATVSTAPPTPIEFIDPQLLDLTDLGEVEVEQEHLQTIFSSALMANEDVMADTSEDASLDSGMWDAMAQDALDRHTETTDTSKEAFVTQYSKVNIVRNSTWQVQSSKLEKHGIPMEPKILAIHPTAPELLHSRDPATPYVYHCQKSNGCPFFTIVLVDYITHVKRCNETHVQVQQESIRAIVDGKGLPCPREGCNSVLANKQSLQVHISRLHRDGWTPKPCEHGCNPAHLYVIKATYDKHQKLKHSATNRFPIQCLFEDCEGTKKFWQTGDYQRHLINDHGIAADDEAGILKYMPTGLVRQIWKKDQPCLTVAELGSSCTRHKFFDMTEMKRHLTGKTHRLSTDEAKDLIERLAQHEGRETKPRIRKPLTIKRQTVEEYEAGEGDLKSNKHRKQKAKTST